MNLHIPVPKQAHVVHVIDGFVLGHRSWKHVSHRLGADLGSSTSFSAEHLNNGSPESGKILSKPLAAPPWVIDRRFTSRKLSESSKNCDCDRQHP